MLVRSLSLNNPGFQSYTPTFSSAGGGAAIGNGTIEGLWRRVGDSIQVLQRITFGSTSTFGSGAFRTTLPNSLVREATKTLSTSNFVPGSVYLLDASTAANNVAAWAECASGSNLVTFVSTRNATGVVAATVPFTWAQSDAINLAILVPIQGF